MKWDEATNKIKVVKNLLKHILVLKSDSFFFKDPFGIHFVKKIFLGTNHGFP